MKALFLIDGEHYIPVNRDGISSVARSRGYEATAAAFIGGMEKIGTPEDLKALGLPVTIEKDPFTAITAAIERHRPDIVVDLSDEPVVSSRRRFEFANLIISHDIPYEGADFRFDPPRYETVCKKPSLSVGGTGKRVGKTALAAFVARALNGQENVRASFTPCIVTMGRGGPPQPEVIEGGKIRLTPEHLLAESRRGKHAASDHYEDALMTRLTTVGCRRCGGGFSGVVFVSVVPEGAKVANELPCDFIVFEGSGASMPPVATDAWIMAVGANQAIEYITGYMGPYRIRKSDLCVLTMCEEPLADKQKIAEMEAAIYRVNPSIRLVKTIFRPKPLEEIGGERVVLTTTAPPAAGEKIRESLEREYRCDVVAMSHHLSHRPKLREDLAAVLATEKPTVLLTEVKAAAIDVVTAIGLEAGLRVVYADNIPIPLEGEPDLSESVLHVAHSAVQRFTAKEAR
ncbi:MAG: 2,3-diphosphoglycerate synthetase [Candidatus Abyssobacteria bacterium SURF_5]|uniref:2,3-diphosphoglycerate synthetase n=1 Tax=Abyssobacteria bacterium (strain SURF_5) TaxID=2093360 RepID=A0A3A4NYL8_ABYX5|nr:MAG: 2,3-diphosphoglycerate synthetase [Candidatus Abyssubacteria bacterium SURF_5]